MYDVIHYELSDFPDLLKLGREIIKDHPSLKEDVIDTVGLAISEANDGGSRDHEEELAINSLNELLEDAKEAK